MSIRMRVDGMLREMVPPSRKMQAAVGTRIKILSEMDIAERRLPPNFFVYVFVATFFGAGLSLAVSGIAGAVALTWGGGRAAGLVFGEYVPYLIYLAFGEATMTGMLLTLAVVYRPRWVATFDDARYIIGR